MTGFAGGGLAGRIGRLVTGRPRLFAGFASGVLVALALRGRLAPITGALIGWDAGVLVYLVLAGLLFVTEPIDNLPARAEAEQDGEWTIFFLTVAAAVVSLIAILGVFATTKGLTPAARNLHIGLVAVTLLISWLMTHTTFAMRYAHEFYAADLDPPQFDRGLEFPGEPRPDYMDFMYFSLVLGMTFQVSDVQITARKLRRLAALHGLLSFLFNTIILALTVNIAAGLV
ncbi:MAG: DUF1345 domain-containing protein [Proteobacteria bacterium]|nr:DUF1345 domain-containing protein [Pseudomonadota bacterium]